MFLPGETQGQRRLAGYGPQSCNESDPNDATWQTCLCHLKYHLQLKTSKKNVGDQLSEGTRKRAVNKSKAFTQL